MKTEMSDIFDVVVRLLRVSISEDHGLGEQQALKLLSFAEDLYRERDEARQRLRELEKETQ